MEKRPKKLLDQARNSDVQSPPFPFQRPQHFSIRSDATSTIKTPFPLQLLMTFGNISQILNPGCPLDTGGLKVQILKTEGKNCGITRNDSRETAL